MENKHLSVLNGYTELLIKITGRLSLNIDHIDQMIKILSDVSIVSNQNPQGLHKGLLKQSFHIMAVLLLFVSIGLFLLLLIDHNLFFFLIKSVGFTIWHFMASSFVILIGLINSNCR